MQRSVNLLPDPDTKYTPFPSGGEFLSFLKVSIPSPSCPAPASVQRHSPLDAGDERLLGIPPSPPLPRFSHEIVVAEMLTKSITFLDTNDECFTPSYGIDDQYVYDYDYNSEEEYTILATWCIIKRASLPVDTFCLASLILKELRSAFYNGWSTEMDVLYRHRRCGRTRELIIVAACVCSRSPCVLTFR